jgi:competence protein ComEC
MCAERVESAGIERASILPNLGWSWQALVAVLVEERDRWPLWIPVGIGAGVLLYFSLPVEPPRWTGPAAVVSLLALMAAMRRRRPVVLIAAALLAPAAGFAASQIQTAVVKAPVLDREVGPEWISGRVTDVEDLDRGRRLILSPVEIPGPEEREVPDKIRIHVPAEPPVWPGDAVEALAVLRPPPAPVAPGAFDFERYAYYRGLGAIGFSLGEVRVAPPTDDPDLDPTIALSSVRQAIDQRIVATLPGEGGTVATALITGERGRIPERILNAMRDSGLAHLLAISGLHIGLVAGLLFFAFRTGLALVPAIALRFPIKKWSAVIALAGALGYLVLAGATIPTQRSFLMVALILLAVMTDRTGVSMRLVAWAAIVVLLLSPESLLGASFQLSFAAVIALVAAYEALRDGVARLRRDRPRWQRPLVYVGGVALTSLVASLATAPYAIANFNRLTVYGLAANMVAVPITAFWIMPFGLVALCLMPFGLESLALVPMGWGIDAVTTVAETVSTWPGAVHILPTPPSWAVALVTAGGLWLCLWRKRWRYFGVAAIVAGAAGLWAGSPPNLLITQDARLIGVEDADNRWLFSAKNRESFVCESWLRMVGGTAWGGWPDGDPSDGDALRCDRIGCIFRRSGWTIAIVLDPRAAEEDCAFADAVVATVPLGADCAPRSGLVIDRFDLWRDGAHALRLTAEAIEATADRNSRGNRPWVRLPDLNSGE